MHGVDYNQCLRLAKAELNTKTNSNSPAFRGRLGSFWCSTRFTRKKKCGVERSVPHWFTCETTAKQSWESQETDFLENCQNAEVKFEKRFIYISNFDKRALMFTFRKKIIEMCSPTFLKQLQHIVYLNCANKDGVFLGPPSHQNEPIIKTSRYFVLAFYSKSLLIDYFFGNPPPRATP